MTSRYSLTRPPADPDQTGQRVLSLSTNLDAGEVVEPVTIYVDYENLRLSLKTAFDLDSGHFDPRKLGELIVGRRRRPSLLREVRVYRSIADPVRDRRRAQDDMRRIVRWMRRDRVVFVGRPLRYLTKTGVIKEKGIDIALAVDVLVNAVERVRDVVVVASRDSDFEPLIDTLLHRDSFQRHVEVVSVIGMSRVTIRDTELPWCHFLSREDFETIRDIGD